jgi:hypothetical protein
MSVVQSALLSLQRSPLKKKDYGVLPHCRGLVLGILMASGASTDLVYNMNNNKKRPQQRATIFSEVALPEHPPIRK